MKGMFISFLCLVFCSFSQCEQQLSSFGWFSSVSSCEYSFCQMPRLVELVSYAEVGLGLGLLPSRPAT